MKKNLLRREFLKSVAATGMVTGVAPIATKAATARSGARVAPASATSAIPKLPSAELTSAGKKMDALIKIHTFDYDGVRLLQSRWGDQFQHGRDFYLNVSNDDILQGFRSEAGLACPGKPLGGWCDKDSSTVFGQWLSGMARIYHATNDTAMRNKASYLT